MSLTEKIKDTEFSIGDIIRITQSTIEGGKEKNSVFEGTVIAFKGRGANKMFTVRRMGIDAVGIEKIYPLYSPTISKILVKRKGHVRRAKLYYLRKKNAR